MRADSNVISLTHQQDPQPRALLSSAPISRLTRERLRLTPEERIRKLDSLIKDAAKLRTSARSIVPNSKQNRR